MPRIRTLRTVFDAESRPAIRVSDLTDRLHDLGAASSSDLVVREVASGSHGLRTIDPADEMLRAVVHSCPEPGRPIGADAVVVEAARRGLRPTPADGVRVLARQIEHRSRRDRARWTRMLHGLGDG